MDQPVGITPPNNIDDLLDATACDGKPRYIDREVKEPVVVLSLAAYWKLKLGPAPAWLEDAWAHAKAAGLDKMTMDEIDEEVAAYRRERAGIETGR